jgi:hypothetical protein
VQNHYQHEIAYAYDRISASFLDDKRSIDLLDGELKTEDDVLLQIAIANDSQVKASLYLTLARFFFRDEVKFEECIESAKELIKNNNDIRMKDLHLRFIQKFKDIDISRQYLSKILRDNNITRKRANFEHFPSTYRGQPRNEKEELKAFFKKISKFSLDDIISIDETSVSTSLSVNYCRNDLGKRCIIKTEDNSVFKKYSLVVAITNKKCIGYKLYDEGAVNSDRFNDFISIILFF